MIDLIQSAKERIDEMLCAAAAAAREEGLLPEGAVLRGTVELPKDSQNGDFAANHALAGAKAAGRPPRELAALLCERLDLAGSWFRSVEIAGPGFINFWLSDKWYADVLSAIVTEGEDYGRCDEGRGRRVVVEFVSANPTGPMHLGNARGGVLGDALASVLERCGWQVSREFYVNDAGNQIEKFAQSLDARYRQLILGESAVSFPEDGYQGEDIRELAAAFRAQEGDGWLERDGDERRAALARFGLDRNLPRMQEDLRRYGIHYDRWFYESSLYEEDYVADTVAELGRRGWTYEKDGALWLATSRLLAERLRRAGKSPEAIEKMGLKDDVLRRANGFYSYFAADIAYHRNKLEKRGFDRAINVWGADHHGHVARMKAALDALGLDGEQRLDIVLMQLVKLFYDGKAATMSKRSGKAISLSTLLDEVPVDAARYFFNSRPETPVEFDLALAVRQDSENPVYYVQYAHARICTLLAALAAEGRQASEEPAPGLLSHETERELIRQLALLPEELRQAGRECDPSRVNRYVTALAGCFHRFYTACRIKGEAPELAGARLLLADCTRRVIALSLGVIGVSAPEHM